MVRFLPWLLLALPGTARTDSSDLVHGDLDPPDLIRGVTVSCQGVGRVWGSPFSWRGEIEFAEPEQRSRFFEQVASWITDLPRYGSVHPHV